MCKGIDTDKICKRFRFILVYPGGMNSFISSISVSREETVSLHELIHRYTFLFYLSGSVIYTV